MTDVSFSKSIIITMAKLYIMIDNWFLIFFVTNPFFLKILLLIMVVLMLLLIFLISEVENVYLNEFENMFESYQNKNVSKLIVK